MRVLIIRGAKVLARPLGSGSPVPLLTEVTEFMTIIESEEAAGIMIVRSSTGEAPDGWRWLSFTVLQKESGDPESNEIGEALLC